MSGSTKPTTRSRSWNASNGAPSLRKAQVWGRLRVPHPENELDKQIAATALVHDLTVVSRNAAHFAASGVATLNPFS